MISVYIKIIIFVLSNKLFGKMDEFDEKYAIMILVKSLSFKILGEVEMLKYTNIDKNNNLVYDEPEKRFPKQELLKEFEKFINVSGFSVKEWKNSDHVPYELIVNKDGINYRLIIFLKNITGAGWADKPNIKRVQVTNVRVVDIDNYINTTDTEALIILGYYNFDNNPIMVAWNAYRYVSHNKNRSCYIDIESLLEGYNNGYITKTCSDQRVWVFRPSYFETFLKNYIEKNKVD